MRLKPAIYIFQDQASYQLTYPAWPLSDRLCGARGCKHKVPLSSEAESRIL